MNLSTEQYKSIIANSLAIAQKQGRIGLSLSEIATETKQKRQFLKLASSDLKKDSVIDHKYDGGLPVLTFTGDEAYLEAHPLPEGFSFAEGGFLAEASKSLKGSIVQGGSKEPKVKASPVINIEKNTQANTISNDDSDILVDLAKSMISYISKNRNDDNNYFHADPFFKDANLTGYTMDDLLNVCGALAKEGYLKEDDLLSELQDANLYIVEDNFDNVEKMSDAELQSLISNYAPEPSVVTSPVAVNTGSASAPASAPKPQTTAKSTERETLSIAKSETKQPVEMSDYLKPLYKLDIAKVSDLNRKEKRQVSGAIIRQMLAEKGDSMNKANLFELTKPVLNVSMPTFSSWLEELVNEGVIHTTKTKARLMYLVEGETSDIGLLQKVEDLKLPKEERKFSTVLDWELETSKEVAQSVSTASITQEQPVQTQEHKVDPSDAFGDDFVFEAFPSSMSESSNENELTDVQQSGIEQKQEPVVDSSAANVQQATSTESSVNMSQQLEALLEEVMGSIDKLNGNNQAQKIGLEVSQSIARLVNYTVEREEECKKWRDATKQFLTQIK
ncbi:hypothetical protein NI385_25360 (plasmid) [Vibrio parahaemolyticus]|uniref:hypothetical protein n=1 Tax=Vibrio vulnificus TaxID=672 RepID=UPI0010D4726C|nr:hypothetical protein [Vibrio parahaemolyticus]EJG0764669.1 hypothetical protein [Vibrio parahaemolyticus O5:K30]HDY7668673.1 hypothetical protein [Vibrio vulnificus]MDG2755681.1 hypothetical protein [Vibrio parahaemolyticus]TBT51583.1 hypothetical protein D5E78_07200 [Vibrio parahaemolyticus]